MLRILSLLCLFVVAFAGFNSGATAQQTAEVLLNPGSTDEKKIPLDQDSELTIEPATGNLLIRGADLSNLGTPDGCDATVDITSFALSSQTQQGGDFSATLASIGAIECSRSGFPESSWDTQAPVSPPPDGTFQFQVDVDASPNPEETLIFSCSNGCATASAEQNIEVVEAADEPDPDLPSACDGLPLPANWSRDLSVLISDPETETRRWSDIFGFSFPNGTSKNIGADRDRFISIRIDISDLDQGDFGTINWLDLRGQPQVGERPPVISLSQCPGDFRDSLSSTCLRTEVQNDISWTTDASDFTRCSLPADGSVIYLNVVHAQQNGSVNPEDWTWACSGEGVCGNLVEP